MMTILGYTPTFIYMIFEFQNVCILVLETIFVLTLNLYFILF